MGVRWGLLSTARVNDVVLAAAARSEVVDVVAVASRRREHAEPYAREHGIDRAFGSYQDLLNDEDVEVVYISLPNSLHAEWSVRALRAGKHVLCEKPLTRRAEDAHRVFKVADVEERILMEGLMYRHHPQTRRIEQLVADGAIGRVQFVRAALSLELKGADIRLSADLDGGALMDLGCYCVSSLRLIGGEAESVFGTQVVAADGVDVRFFGTLLFPDEVVGQFDVALTMPRRDQFEIVGTDGSIFVADPWVCANPGIDLRRGGETERLEIDPVDHYQLELENMSRAIRGVEGPLLGRDDALGQARTIEALYASAEAGRTMALAELGS